jgi:tyrosyl-tRNA synthetase
MNALTDKELQEQVLLLTRGCEALYTQEELLRRLREAASARRQLRVKLGLDPTAPDIHLGHTVVLRKMRQFQDLGHRAVLIIGDYTARIGDPSGQNKTRPVLTAEQIETNARTYFEQAGKILDTSPAKLEIRRNSEWLEKLSLMELIQLAAKKTVAQMLQRDSFRKRLQEGQDVFLHEFLYPIMQGYDSVKVQADVELGGSDQTFNNLVGRDIQKMYGQAPQIVLIMPILVGLDGVEKMSKSKGNYVGVTDSPRDMFGKVMSIPDDLMDNYFTLLSDLPRAKIDELVSPARTHPRQAKAMLGRMIVEAYHSSAAAQAASDEFDRIFAQKQFPDEMPDVRVPAGRMNIVELVSLAGFSKSKGEARRLIMQKAVSLDGVEITDVEAEVDLKPGQVLRVGKRRFGRISM